MSRSKQNYDSLVGKDGNYLIDFDNLGRIRTAISPDQLSSGPQGVKGEIGPEGPQGEKGPQGQKGDTTSAYQPKDSVASAAQLPGSGNDPGDVRLTEDTQEFYVWGGSSWTSAGSVVPVKGEKGEAGATGAKGNNGTMGLQGAPGVDGSDGAKGEKGEVGADGVKGDVGPQGERGLKGEPADATQYFTKGQSDTRYTQIEGDTMTGRLDIDLSDETAAGLRLRGGFAMKMKGETIGGENLFYSASSNNSVSYNGIITEDGHITTKKYVDDVMVAQSVDLSDYYTKTQSGNLFLTQTGNQVLDDCRLTINNPSDGKATAFVTDSDMYAGNAYRTADGGTINIDGKPKIKLTEFAGSVTIIDVSAENVTKTLGLTLEGNTENGNGLLLQAMHPSSGYDSINYYGKTTDGHHIANVGYVNTKIGEELAGYATEAYVTQQMPNLANYATLADLEAAAPVGNEVVPPIIIPEVAFQYSASQSLTSTTVGPADKKLWGFYNGTSNEWIGNWQAIKINRSSIEGGQPAETTEENENRIIEFYDRNSGNLLLKFVASYVKNYGIFTVIGRRYKMIANAGQANNQNTRGSMF